MIDALCQLSGLSVEDSYVVVLSREAGQWSPVSYPVETYFSHSARRFEVEDEAVELLDCGVLKRYGVSFQGLLDRLMEPSGELSVCCFSREVVGRLLRRGGGDPVRLLDEHIHAFETAKVREKRKLSLGRLQHSLELYKIPWSPVRFDQVDDSRCIHVAISRFSQDPVLMHGVLEYVRENEDEAMTMKELIATYG